MRRRFFYRQHTIDVVSIHAPVKGATVSMIVKDIELYGFNSRTRKGCDARPKKEHQRHGVSIHAPVKGATVQLAGTVRTGRVSIHAPVKGATQLTIWLMHNRSKFQFTHP